MLQQDPDRVIRLVQSSTRNLMESFREKTGLLRQSSMDIKKLMREGYDRQKAYETAMSLFGKNRVKFVAIDGTESEDQEMDMLVFYAGAFGYVGDLEFNASGKGCSFSEPVEIESSISISAAISVHEQDASRIAGETTEGGIEVDSKRIPTGLMHLSEYYMAVLAIQQDPEIKVVIVDRTLAGDVGHLVWSVSETLESGNCALLGIQTEYGRVTGLDLELARMLHPNDSLSVPAARSHFIKYAAINELCRMQKEGRPGITYDDLLAAVGAHPDRLDKLEKEFCKLDEKHHFLQDTLGCSVAHDVGGYWSRVLAAAMMVCEHIFNTPEGQNPLILEDENGSRWITANDLDYLVLVMIYALLRAAWEKNVLVLGIIKDVAAGELAKTVVPLLQSAGKLELDNALPRFNSDKMLLQTASVINAPETKAPWRTFEFDACFRTVAPIDGAAAAQPLVAGAFKNVITAERMFVKSYFQLWASENDPYVRSHVFSYDRPCYPEYDASGELELLHRDGQITEKISPAVFFKSDSAISHLVMDVLCSMSYEVIPECLGHNYGLFLADKKAKSVLEGSKNAYLSAVSLEMAKSEFDQQVLFEAHFREYRSEIESKRRGRA